MSPCLLSVALLAGAFISQPAHDADKALMKAIEPGPLGEFFTILSVKRGYIDPSGGEIISFKLKARKEVDTAKLPVFRFGFFDKESHLHVVDDLRIHVDFILKAGETIDAELYHHENRENLWEGKKPVKRDWQRVVVQKAERPRQEEVRELLRQLLR